MKWPWIVWACTLPVLAVGCAGFDTAEGANDGTGFFGPGGDLSGGATGGNGGGVNTTGEGGQAGDGLPPEEEESISLDVPQAGRSVVYVANPSTNRVAVVNADTLVVETVQSGLAPTYVATVPGQDAALVLNLGTRDASFLKTRDGKTAVKRLEVGHDQNAIAVAPDGRHAIIYFDARRADALAETYQDITVVSLAEGKETARGVSVGFKPQSVQFAADSSHAFVITEDGVSIVDLTVAETEPLIAHTVSVGDRVGLAVSSDVQVTADGRYAVARREGDDNLRLVDLESGEIASLSVADLPQLVAGAQQADAALDAGGGDAGADAPDAGDADAGAFDASSGDAGERDAGVDAAAPVGLPAWTLALTDLDLAPDGKTAFAVVRGLSALLRIPLPEAFTDPSLVEVMVVEDLVVGSVSVDKAGNVAALYTTASPVEALVLLDLKQGGAPRAVRLRKAVRAVALSDDGSRALVLHTAEATSLMTDDAKIDAAEGYSLVNTQTAFVKLELTPAAIREHQLLLTPDARRLFMLLRADSSGIRALQVADLDTFQIHTEALAQPPLSLGLLPGVDQVFVGEENEGGRITFFDRETGALVAALTGFELASRIAQ